MPCQQPQQLGPPLRAACAAAPLQTLPSPRPHGTPLPMLPLWLDRARMRSTLLARCLRSHHYPTPFRHPARMSPLFLCFPSGWTGRGCVQPAAEPRHVQRHNHALNVWERTNAVWGAQRALPAATTVERSLHVACATAASPTPYCFPSRVSPFFRCFPFDAAASVGVQPAAKLRHVQRHKYAIHVYGALYACPASSLHSWALPARCLRRHRYSTATPPLL